MTSKEFISVKLQDLVVKFPYMKCRYEVDAFSNSHFIEIKPQEDFRFNGDYAQYELEITMEFINHFPCESITFLTEGDLITIESPILEVSGESYGTEPLVKTFLEDTIHIAQDSKISLPKIMPEFIKNVYQKDVAPYHLEEVTFALLTNQNVNAVVNIDSNYAMAA